MNRQLAEKLIEYNVITVDSKVSAKVKSKGLAGDPIEINKELVITQINNHGCNGYNMREPNISYSATFDNIYEVGGMDLDRIAKAFNLYADGSPRKIGKKPGRKPKEQ